MTAVPCPRQFEAEAMRDGRLTGAELARFAQHMKVCPACSGEAQALDRLGEAIRASARDYAGADELRVRRERTRLLAAFDRALVSSERRSGMQRRLLWPALAAAVLGGTFVFWRARGIVHRVSGSNVVIRADDSAIWSRHTLGNRERIVLERGALFVHVDHSASGGRLVIELPDGELEDTGTTFTVSAKDGHTTRVAVQEGRVVLRIRDMAAVAIGPGEPWTADARLAVRDPSAAGSAAPPGMDASAPRPERVIDDRPSAPMPSAQRRRAAAPRSAARPPDPPDASLGFYAAMAAFDRGDYRQAAAGFAEFLVAHPDDPRAEDAAYLRVMSFHKCGDKGSMKDAVLSYLSRYPTGFRRVEIERLVR
jgi:hypothetical protein